MKTTPRLGNFTASLISLASLAGTAHGAITVTIYEDGDNVVASFSGSLDLSGDGIFYADSYGNPGGGQSITPGNSDFNLGSSSTMDIYRRMDDPGFTPLGSGSSPIYASSSEGDLFACWVFGPNYYVYVPGDYVFGSQIAGSSTWNDTTITAMGLTPDSSHVFTLPNDTFTVNVGSSVPEPSTTALFGLFTAASLFTRRRRSSSSIGVPASLMESRELDKPVG